MFLKGIEDKLWEKEDDDIYDVDNVDDDDDVSSCRYKPAMEALQS